MKSKLLMFIATLIASSCASFVQAQKGVPYLPVKASFGGTSVDMVSFSPAAGDYTLEVEGTAGTKISVAGGAYEYTPETTGKVRFAQRNGKVYVYEGNMFIAILTPVSKAVFPDIFADADDSAADPATGIYDSRNLFKNPGFELKDDGTPGTADNYLPLNWTGDNWKTSGGSRARFDISLDGREGHGTMMAHQGNYIAQEVVLKSNTPYKLAIRRWAHNAANQRGGKWYIGFGSDSKKYEIFRGEFQNPDNVDNYKKYDHEFAFTTGDLSGYEKVVFSAYPYDKNGSQNFPLTHYDRVTLVEGVAQNGIEGATAATYLVGAAYAPEVTLEEGGYYDMTTYALANPDANEGNSGWIFTGTKNDPRSNESWLGTTPVNPYFDGGDWGATSWTTTMSQTIKGLPAGKYTLSAVTRASVGVAMTLSLKSGASVKEVICPSVGSTGGGIWDAAAAGSVEKGVNGGNGFGWSNSGVQIDLLAGEPLTVTLNSTTPAQHEWFSADQFRLVYVAADPNPVPVVPAAPVPAATVKPVVTGEYVIYHPASKKYLANTANADAPALSDYGIFTTHDAYTWDIKVSADTMVLKQLSSSNYMNANTGNAWGILLRPQLTNESKWLLRDVQDGYNFSSVRTPAKLIGMDGITGNYIGIYYDKDATKNPLFQFVNKEDFFAAADVVAYDAYIAELAVYNAKKDLLAEITRANTLVESHPAAYTPEATAAYEAVMDAARNVFLNDAATIQDVKAAMATISGPLNTYLMSVITTASEENPVDVSFLIKNPDFNANNANGWNGAVGAANNTVYEVFAKAFDMNQKLAGLPAGYYQLKAQSFARATGNDGGAAYKAGTEKIQSFLYGKVGEVVSKKAIMSLYAEQNTGTLNGYANSMAEANTAFQAGKYINNQVDGIFMGEGTNDTLTIGVKYEAPLVANSWTIFDNFQLIYKGNTLGTLVKEVEAMIAQAQAINGVMQTAVETALANEITAAEVIVAAANPTKEELDGAIEKLTSAMEMAQKSIAAYGRLNKAIIAAGESTVATEAAVVAAIAAAQGVYDAKAADEEGIRVALVALNGTVNATIVANAVNGDVTLLIKNPNILQTATSVQIRPAGWENSTNSGTNGNFTKAAATATELEVNTFLEAWNGTASTIKFDYNQILANVPNGVYVLSAATFTQDTSGNAVLYGNKTTAPMKTGLDGGNFFDVKNPATNTTLTVVVTNDTLQIGVKTIGILTGSWSGADYFKLTYLGDQQNLKKELTDSVAVATGLKDNASAFIVKAEMNKLVAAINRGNVVLAAEDFAKMNGALDTLKVAIVNARTSIGLCTDLAALFAEATALIAQYKDTFDPAALQAVLDKNLNMYQNQTDQTDNAALVAAKAEMKAAIDAYKQVIIDDVETVDANSVKVYVNGSSIVVEGADKYDIYTEAGIPIVANIELVPGMYIVKVAGETIKIQVK